MCKIYILVVELKRFSAGFMSVARKREEIKNDYARTNALVVRETVHIKLLFTEVERGRSGFPC